MDRIPQVDGMDWMDGAAARMIRWYRRREVQNIAEGSEASATSREMELKLTSVARASLEELRRDFEDYLRQRDAGCPPDSRQAGGVTLVANYCKLIGG